MIRRSLIAGVVAVFGLALLAGLWMESSPATSETQLARAAGRYHAKGKTQSFYKRVG